MTAGILEMQLTDEEWSTLYQLAHAPSLLPDQLQLLERLQTQALWALLSNGLYADIVQQAARAELYRGIACSCAVDEAIHGRVASCPMCRVVARFTTRRDVDNQLANLKVGRLISATLRLHIAAFRFDVCVNWWVG